MNELHAYYQNNTFVGVYIQYVVAVVYIVFAELIFLYLNLIIISYCNEYNHKFQNNKI